jgi:DNA-binding response OmpR family regulator
MITTNNSGKNILVIDDEKHIAEAIALNLHLQGHNVSLAENGLIGLEKLKKEKIDLIVVDLMMPELDGVGVIREVRKINAKIPILVISAKDQVSEKVKCLSLGVDDYLSKPFNLEEFLLRIDRLITRTNWNIDNVKLNQFDNFKFGKNEIDFINLKAKSINGEYDLTLQEVKLLKYFIDNHNITLSREKILEEVLGYDPDSNTRTLDNFIVRFRKYFEDDAKNPKFFKSVRSVGYIFDIKD